MRAASAFAAFVLAAAPLVVAAHDLAGDLSLVEASLAESEKRLDSAEAMLVVIEARAEHAFEAFRRAAAAFDAARAAYEAMARYERAGGGALTTAIAAYKEAEMGYRNTAYALIVFAGTAALGKVICAGRMSTGRFRAENGISDPNIDIDHIIPRKYGGADHPLNYQPLPSSLNRSLGAGGLPEKCFANPVGCGSGLFVTALTIATCR